MIQTLTEEEFVRLMSENQYSDFSHDALRHIFRFCKEIEEDTGIKVEFDPVAIVGDCYELTEAEAIKEFALETIDDLEKEVNYVVYLDDPATYLIFY